MIIVLMSVEKGFKPHTNSVKNWVLLLLLLLLLLLPFHIQETFALDKNQEVGSLLLVVLSCPRFPNTQDSNCAMPASGQFLFLGSFSETHLSLGFVGGARKTFFSSS